MASTAAAPLAAPAFDVEKGRDATGEEEEEVEQFPILYSIVYGFSLFMLVAGVWAFFFPFSNSTIVADLAGFGGLATGIFLMLNSDLMVTFMRLLQEMHRFRESNQKYRKNLSCQKKKIRKLQETQKALERLDRLANGNMGNMQAEMLEMRSNSRDSTRMNIVGILTVIRPKQEDIRAGKDLDTLVDIFTSMYGHVVLDVEKRLAEMMKGLDASPRWQKEQTMSVDKLKFIFASTLFEEMKDLKSVVTSSVEEATVIVEEPSAVQPQEVKAVGAHQDKSAAAGTDDDWADAMAFADQ